MTNSLGLLCCKQGADRNIRIPDELSRFQELPMTVVTIEEPTPRIFQFLGSSDEITRWKYADVRANRSLGKGRGLTKKQKEAIFEIGINSLVSVNLHIDI